jgi:dTDP-4-dehydrorhamnose 3,5-epimerase
MKIIRSKKLNLKIIYPSTFFKDHRGAYLESFNKNKYKKLLNKEFIEDDICISKKNVVRGIHGDNKTWKLISCPYGKCLSIIFNCDKSSKNFGKWEKFNLDSKKYFQILVPPKYGNSFIVLSKIAVYHYKQTNYYNGSDGQFTYNIKDPFFKLKIKNIKKLIFSKRDKYASFVNQVRN